MTVAEDLAAAARRHPRAETVGTDTADIVRLIRAFHGSLARSRSRDALLGAPLTAFAARFGRGRARKEAPERGELLLIIQAKEGQLNDAVQEIEGILRQRRGVKSDEPNNFDVKTADSFIAQFDGILGGVGLAAIAISCLGLLVGGIGVMNIMLVSVTERTKEIGIRKAVGATRSAIVLQFLLEAMTLTFFGGVLGVVIAIGISNLILLLIPSIPAQVPLWAVLAGLFTSVGVGLIFGVFPAMRAARLDPIECLRYE